MITPEPGKFYEIGTCSGESRRWRFDGLDANGIEWWYDLDEKRELSDTSLMYAWWVFAELPHDAK